MAQLALKAVALGADKIPDSVFESIPGGYFKEKDKEDRQKEKKKSKDRRERDGDRDRRERDADRDRRARSEGRTRRDPTPPTDNEQEYYSEYTDNEQPQERPSQRRRHSHRSQRQSRSERSDPGRSSRSERPARDPSPLSEEERGTERIEWDNDNEYQLPLGGRRPSAMPEFAAPQARAYNPAEYLPGPTEEHEYYNGQTANGGSNGANAGYDPANPYARDRSSTPDRYRPKWQAPAYDPIFPNQPSQSQPQKPAPTAYAPYNPADFVPPTNPLASQRSVYSPSPNLANQVGPYTGPPPPGSTPSVASPQVPSAAQARYQPPGYQPPSYQPPAAQTQISPYHSPVSPSPPRQYPSPPIRERRNYRPVVAPDPYDDDYDRRPRRRSHSRSRYDPDRDRDRDRRNRRHSTYAPPATAGRSRSKSRIRAKFEEFKNDPEKRNVGVSALGALAGGLAGREMGKSTFETLLGAALGGFGAHELDRRERKKKTYRKYDDGYESY